MKQKRPEAALLSIGDELLSGKTINTHPEYLGRKLLEHGIRLAQEMTVPDSMDAIKEALEFLRERYQLVFTTGGLGPTDDDITREAISEALGLPLEEREELLEMIEDRLKSFGASFSEIHKKYLLVPQGFEPIPNDKGIAPGLWGRFEDTFIAVLPGPPRELQAVFQRLEAKLKALGKKRILFKTIRTFGLREAEIAEILKPYMKELKPIGFYPSLFGVDLRLEASSEAEAALEELNLKRERIRSLLGENVYGEDEDTLQSVLGQILRKKRMTVATAESCTGGLVSNLITDVSGSSLYMIGSVVAYHNRLKEELLGVPSLTLLEFGAVSEPTALSMAEGVRKLFNVDVGLSTTGIAGPTGGTPLKPVGLVYMGVSIRGKTRVKRNIFQGNRLEIKKQSALSVIDLARRMLLEMKSG